MRSVRLTLASLHRFRTIGAVRPRPGTADVVVENELPSRTVLLEPGWHWYGYDVVEGDGSFLLIAEDASTGRQLAVSPPVSTRDGCLSRRFRFEIK